MAYLHDVDRSGSCISFIEIGIGIRPVFHPVTERVTGHLFISVLAYHLVHSVRYRLKQSQINNSWSQLRNQLEGQSRVTVYGAGKHQNYVLLFVP